LLLLENDVCYDTDDIGLCGEPICVKTPWIWSCVRTHKNVHDSHELCQRMGCWISSPGCHQYTMLDWNSLKWTLTHSTNVPLNRQNKTLDFMNGL
jgi:hypothetical protein